MKLLHSYIFVISLPIIFYFFINNHNFFVGGQSVNLYTKQEKAAIAKFRPLVTHLLIRDFQQRDGYLLRWLRSHNFDLKTAAVELEKTHQWRQDNNIDNILDGDLNAHQEYLPYKLDGFDRDGRPIIQLYFGKWQLRTYIYDDKRKDATKEFKRMLEGALQNVFKIAESTGRDIDQFYFLVDFDKFTISETLCLQCVPLTLDFARIFDFGSNVFVKNLTLINVPWYFQPALKLVKQIFGTLALKSLNDYDSNKGVWRPAILMDIAPDQLPYSITGESESHDSPLVYESNCCYNYNGKEFDPLLHMNEGVCKSTGWALSIGLSPPQCII